MVAYSYSGILLLNKYDESLIHMTEMNIKVNMQSEKKPDQNEKGTEFVISLYEILEIAS